MSTPSPKNKRRRSRELALQALCTLEFPNPGGLNVMLFRLRERALIAEAELLVAEDKLDEATAVVNDLLVLDSRHAYGLELSRTLSRRTLLPMPPSDEERLELEATRGLNEELSFSEQLVRGVQSHQDELDALISSCSTNWRVPRMAMVDRNILRIAAYELAHLKDIPSRVTLNEAIELGKRYGTSDSGAFINGLLDKVASRVRGEKQSSAARPPKGEGKQAQARPTSSDAPSQPKGQRPQAKA